MEEERIRNTSQSHTSNAAPQNRVLRPEVKIALEAAIEGYQDDSSWVANHDTEDWVLGEDIAHTFYRMFKALGRQEEAERYYNPDPPCGLSIADYEIFTLWRSKEGSELLEKLLPFLHSEGIVFIHAFDEETIRRFDTPYIESSERDTRFTPAHFVERSQQQASSIWAWLSRILSRFAIMQEARHALLQAYAMLHLAKDPTQAHWCISIAHAALGEFDKTKKIAASHDFSTDHWDAIYEATAQYFVQHGQFVNAVGCIHRINTQPEERYDSDDSMYWDYGKAHKNIVLLSDVAVAQASAGQTKEAYELLNCLREKIKANADLRPRLKNLGWAFARIGFKEDALAAFNEVYQYYVRPENSGNSWVDLIASTIGRQAEVGLAYEDTS